PSGWRPRWHEPGNEPAGAYYRGVGEVPTDAIHAASARPARPPASRRAWLCRWRSLCLGAGATSDPASSWFDTAVDQSDASNASTQTYFGEPDRSAQRISACPRLSRRPTRAPLRLLP